MKAFKILAFSIFFGASLNAQVGFGTTSPSNDIDVESSSATATAVDINCTGAGDPKINFQLSGTSTFSMGIDNSDADKFKIGTSALETNTRFTIDASGNVGIGTTSPHAPLQLANVVLNRKIVLWEDSDNDHQFYGFGVNNAILRYQIPATANHVFYASTSSTASNELMRITSTGNVGIGTSSPTSLLHVNGSTNLDGTTVVNETGAAVNFRVESDANATMLFVDGTNNRVGIGTYTPNASLDVSGGVLVRAFNPIVSQGLHLQWNRDNGSGKSYILNQGGNGGSLAGIVFGKATTSDVITEQMFLSDGGYLGIGTTSPTSLLHVNGSTNLDGTTVVNETGAAKNFRVESDNNTAMLYVDGTNDRIGIGTSTPTDKVQIINGDIRFNDNYGIRAQTNENRILLKSFVTEFYNYGGWISNGQGFLFSNADGLEFQIGNDGVYSKQKLAIGTKSLTYTLTVNGQPGANGFTAFTNYSDSRLKTNISSLDTGALSKIMQLRPVSFQYNQKYLQLYPNSDLQKVHKGFIAQEIRQVFPEMVSEMKASPDSVQYLDLDVSHLQIYLVKAMQEQQAIINAQKAEIEAQKAEAILQKAEIDTLKQNALKVAELENKMNAMLLLLNNKTELTVKQ